MNIEDIKVGETYNVRMKVTHKEKDQVCVKNPMISVYGCDYMIISHKYIHAIHEQPKYDPYRKLKCGDVVELVEWNGRFPIPKSYFEDIGIKTFRVVAEECRGIVTIDILGTPHPLPICFIKLNTPVEEIEPYYIVENDIEFQVRMKYEDKDCLISVFRFKNIVEGYKQYYDMLPTMKQAREAAEAECKRLNEEYRKEKNND